MEADYSKCYLLVGIPTIDYMHWAFVKSLTGLVTRLSELKVNYAVHYEAGSLIYISRDKIVTTAIDRHDTHVLWLDSDMVFEADIFEKLYATMNEQRAPLVSGLYNSRHGNGKPVLYTSLSPTVERLETYPDKKTFDIEGCGFGCCLTRVDMLMDIWNHEGTCFMPTALFGEDLAFCERANQIRGYHMVADSEVRCGHISHKVIWPDQRTEQLIL